MKHARRILPTLAAVTAMMLLANRMVSDKETSLLEAQGAIGPGAQLQLNTAQGPMLLTVDSEITPQGYVHAYGQNDGQYYAGYIKLSPTNVQAQQILSQAPTFAQQQLMADPINRPQSETIYTARARQAAAAASNNRNVQLSVAANGMVRLNGQVVVPSDARTTSVLRLMEKQAQLRQEQVARTQLLAQIAVPGGDGDLNAALASAKARVHLLEEDKAKIDGTTMLAQVPFLPHQLEVPMPYASSDTVLTPYPFRAESLSAPCCAAKNAACRSGAHRASSREDLRTSEINAEGCEPGQKGHAVRRVGTQQQGSIDLPVLSDAAVACNNKVRGCTCRVLESEQCL